MTAYSDKKLFHRLLSGHYSGKTIEIKELTPMPLDNSSSILVTLTAASGAMNIGHFRYLVSLSADGREEQLDVVMKVKPHGATVAGMLCALAAANSPELGQVYQEASDLTGFSHTHEKELNLSANHNGNAIFPVIYGTLELEGQDLFIVLMEYLGDLELIDSVMEPEKWSDTHIRAALDQAAAWHASQMGDSITGKDEWPDAPTGENRKKLETVYRSLWKNAEKKLPDLLAEKDYLMMQQLATESGAMQQLFDRFPKTRIHNDMNPRNSAFRRKGDSLEFVLYDWELSTWHLPQYDAIELLCFVLDEDRYDHRKEYLEYYRTRFETHSGFRYNDREYEQLLYWLHLDFAFLRLGMYLMAHALSPYPFLPRVVKSCMNGIEQYQNSSLLNRA